MEHIQKDIIDFTEEADSWNIVSTQLEEILIEQDPRDAANLMDYIDNQFHCAVMELTKSCLINPDLWWNLLMFDNFTKT